MTTERPIVSGGRSAAEAAAGFFRLSAPARHHIRRWVLIVVGVIAVGTAGYMAITGWPFDDALYMTVITMTTVGFREVRALDDVGRAWTMLLSIAGVAIIFGSIGILAELILTEAASGRRERRRMAHAVGLIERALRALRLWPRRHDRGPGAEARRRAVRDHRHEPRITGDGDRGTASSSSRVTRRATRSSARPGWSGQSA